MSSMFYERRIAWLILGPGRRPRVSAWQWSSAVSGLATTPQSRRSRPARQRSCRSRPIWISRDSLAQQEKVPLGKELNADPRSPFCWHRHPPLLRMAVEPGGGLRTRKPLGALFDAISDGHTTTNRPLHCCTTATQAFYRRKTRLMAGQFA